MLQESKLDSHLRISAQSSRALCVPSPFNLVSRIIIRSHWFCWAPSASWTVRFKSQAHIISRAFIGTRFSFASLAYYQDYLRSLTSPRFLNTPLVTQAILRGQLFPWVECQLPKPSYGICATGTSFDDYNDWTAGSLRKGYEVFHRNCSKNKVPRADVVKRDGLKKIRTGCMHKALPSRQQPETPVPSNVEASAPTTSAFPFFRGQVFHFVPKRFKLLDLCAAPARSMGANRS